MRVLVQWATTTVTDWVAYDITRIQDVRAMPKKPAPSDSPLIDDQPGWIAALNIQGVVFTGYDHIGFGMVGGALLVYAWNDDPEDFPVGTRWGQIWTIPNLGPARGVAVNTNISVVWYCEPNALPVQMGLTDFQPWSAMSFPNANNTIHGVWVSDTHWDALAAARSMRGWREWIA